MMWRDFDDPQLRLAPAASLPIEAPARTPVARVAQRRRLQVADGLCRVARHAAPRARRRRHELLLISRAAAVRTELLEAAALVRSSNDPDPECIADLHTLLTSGCDSPLYNPDVPAQQLQATLDRARTTLATPTAFSEPTHTSQGGTAWR
jgi:hypothetical protein